MTERMEQLERAILRLNFCESACRLGRTPRDRHVGEVHRSDTVALMQTLDHWEYKDVIHLMIAAVERDKKLGGKRHAEAFRTARRFLVQQIMAEPGDG